MTTGTGQSHDCLWPPQTHSPAPPRCPLTFVGVGEPDLGGAGVGAAESRFWGGGGGAGGVAGPPRTQAATQEAPHEGGGGGTPHQAAASCRERAQSSGELRTVSGAVQALITQPITLGTATLHWCMPWAHTQPSCHMCPSCDCVPRAHPAPAHTQVPCAHSPHGTMSLMSPCPSCTHPPCPLRSHTPHTPSPTGLRRAPERARHSRAVQGPPEPCPVRALSTHTGVPAHGRLCTRVWLPTLLLPVLG